jgi:uncharacterized membrane protein YbhN (UPF0104 family)
MNWKTFRYYFRIFLYVIGIGFFVFFLQRNLSSFFEKIKLSQLNFSALLLAFLLIAFVYAFQIYNFWIVIKGYVKETTFRSTVIAYASSFMPKYIPGYVWGYVSRGDSFMEIANVPYKTTLVVSIFEILYFVSSGLFLLGLNYIISNSLNIFILLTILILPVFEWHLIQVLGKRLLKLFKIDVQVIFPFKTWLITFLISFLEWFVYGLSLAFIHQALVQDKLAFSTNALFNYSSIFSESWIAGFFAFLIPMGLGIRELLLSRGVQRVLGASQIVSGVIASVSRVLIIFAEGLWFLFALILRKRLPKPQ